MSNEVYGYLESNNLVEQFELQVLLEEKTGVGVKPIPVEELYNFPKTLLPKKSNRTLCFCIGDKPGKSNATYLIDNLDYASEADIGLPIKGQERLELLVNLFKTMIKEASATHFVVALTDSSQIEDTKTVELQNLSITIINDFNKYSPPNCLYEVIISD